MEKAGEMAEFDHFIHILKWKQNSTKFPEASMKLWVNALSCGKHDESYTDMNVWGGKQE